MAGNIYNLGSSPGKTPSLRAANDVTVLDKAIYWACPTVANIPVLGKECVGYPRVLPVYRS